MGFLRIRVWPHGADSLKTHLGKVPETELGIHEAEQEDQSWKLQQSISVGAAAPSPGAQRREGALPQWLPPSSCPSSPPLTHLTGCSSPQRWFAVPSISRGAAVLRCAGGAQESLRSVRRKKYIFTVKSRVESLPESGSQLCHLPRVTLGKLFNPEASGSLSEKYNRILDIYLECGSMEGRSYFKVCFLLS